VATLALVAALVLGYGLTPGGAFRAQQAGTEAAGVMPFNALTWRNLGPNRGGRSIAVAGSDARPYEYYFGATGGGLWKTEDGGTTWKPVTDKYLKYSSVGAVAVAPSNPDIVYVGTGESEIRGDIAMGDGVYKSTDAGKTWTHVGLTNTQVIAKIRIDPSNPDIVYAAAFGHPYGPNPDRGVFKSTDGGKTWNKVLYRDDKTGAADLSMDPHNPQVLYASLWEANRTPYSMSSGGPGSGLFKTTDGGAHWTELTRNPGLPGGVIGKIGVSESPVDPNRVYAIVEAAEGGVFVSDDGGATWTLTNSDRDLRQRAFYYTRIYADPKVKDEVYVLNTGMYRSTDGGKTFKSIRTPHGDDHDLWIASNDTARMIEGNDGGANVTINGGQTWTEQDYPTGQFYHVIATTKIPYDVCGAQQDSSTACVSSAPGEADSFYDVGGGESGYIASDPRNPNIFYAGSYGGLITRYDHATGQVRAINPYPDNPMGYSSQDIKERFQWTTPIVIAPTDPSVIYVGSQHLWKSTNEGQSWQPISPDLTLHEPDTMGPSGGPITLDQSGVETYATIFAIAPSPKDANVIWTGSDDGLVHVTKDGGQHWTNVTPKGLPHLSRISIIEASPFRPGSAYVAANHYQMDDFAPYVYRTDDYGATWTTIVNGLPADDYARSIREDPGREHLLYLGTEHGVYLSFDNGDNWQSMRQNLPDTPVHDLTVKGDDLVIATHGRAFYVLDDISPIRQWTAQTSTEALHLFKPVTARLGLDRGARIDYYLKSDAQKVTIDFLDAQGKTIRTFTGTPEEKKTENSSSDEEEEEFFRGPRMNVETKAGMHRFTWDMRYPGPTTFPGMILWAASSRGPVAPPGTYQVRVTADGATQTQPLTIEKDPRLTQITDADLQKQFQLAIQIRDRESDANNAVIAIRDLKSQIDDRLKKADALPAGQKDAVVKAGQSLTQQLSTIEEAIYQVKNRSDEDPLNFPIKLNNRIGALGTLVGIGQYPPTAQDYTVFTMLSDALQTQLTRLDQTVSTGLPALNQALTAAKLDPVTPKPRTGV
jgi:photosystem II stability/assembly factor-like uncharacterized protein